MVDAVRDALDSRLLNELQVAFPVTESPFDVLGRNLGIPGAEAVSRTARLKADGLIRRISAIIDWRRLGYHSTLIALSLPVEKLEEAAAVVSLHPGVSHNYARQTNGTGNGSGPGFNLWFTLMVPPEADLDSEANSLAQRAGALAMLNLPATRVFKIAANFNMVDSASPVLPVSAGRKTRPSSVIASPSASLRTGSAKQSVPSSLTETDCFGTSCLAMTKADDRPSPNRERGGLISPALSLSSQDKAVLRVLSNDLSVVESPFDAPAIEAGMPVGEMLDRAKGLLEAGAIRRYGAVLHHRNAGFVANGLTCWKVPAGVVEVVGAKMASFPMVSHCYERKVSSGWSYNLFTMLHALTYDGCRSVAGEISKATGISDYLLLFSTHEYKKEGVRYL